MTAADWDIVIKAGLGLMTSVVIPWAIVEYRRRTGVQVTDQERAAVIGAMTTAAGVLQTQLDQGKIRISDITPTSPVVTQAASDALGRVPDSAKAQGTSVSSAAAIITAKVDTSPKPMAPVSAP